jgi:hypothetical protein
MSHLISAILDFVEARMPKEYEPSATLEDGVYQLIFEQKTKMRKILKERLKRMTRFRKLLPLAIADNKKLMKNKLTEKNSLYKYKDKRIYTEKVPDHLKRVLQTNTTRNVCMM